MRARDVVGRRIVGVKHFRWYNEEMCQWENDCVELALDNGSVIRVHAYEPGGETEPVATLLLVKAAKGAG